jgi:hypothetical protein
MQRDYSSSDVHGYATSSARELHSSRF